MNLYQPGEIIGVDIPDGGTYNIPTSMSNNIFVASGFKNLSKVTLPMGNLLSPSGTGTKGEFIYVCNMGDISTKPVLEVVKSRNKREFVEIGGDISSAIVTIQWGETALFYVPSNGARFIYYIRMQSQTPAPFVMPDSAEFKALNVRTGIGNHTPKFSISQIGGYGHNDPYKAIAPKVIDDNAVYLQIGGKEYNTGSYRLIGLGYKLDDATLPPVLIGMQETTSSGNTSGDFVVFIRPSTGSPVEVFRVTKDGQIKAKAAKAPVEDSDLVNKKYVDDQIENTSHQSGDKNVIFLDDAAAVGHQVPSQAMAPGDTIYIDSPNTFWTVYSLNSQSFKVGDEVIVILQNGKKGNFGQMCVVQFNDGTTLTMNGKKYSGIYVSASCVIKLTCIKAGLFFVKLDRSDETILTTTLSNPIG